MTQAETFLDGRVTLHCGDCMDVLALLPDCSVDSVCCDPPYHLTSIVKRFGAKGAAPAKAGKTGAYARASAGFMGKQWDGGDIAFRPEIWAQVWRVLKPGGHLVAFSGTRTYHRMACAIEDAGFEIRDQIGWCYGSGFPKSHDVSKSIDRTRGGVWRGRSTRALPNQSVAKGIEYIRVEKGEPITDEARAWDGWGTALKPAWEPICIGRKPLIGTVAENVLRFGTGALNVVGCRVGDEPRINEPMGAPEHSYGGYGATATATATAGRWPANLCHDGSNEVIAAFCSEDGSAARFFYTAKADSDDRIGSKHPTVKPVDLMQWLVRLITPPGGIVLDPFSGTGTTGEAAWREGFSAILIEREPEYQDDIRRRMKLAICGPEERGRESIKARGMTADAGPLFGDHSESRGGAGRFTESSRTRTAEEINRADRIEMVKP